MPSQVVALAVALGLGVAPSDVPPSGPARGVSDEADKAADLPPRRAALVVSAESLGPAAPAIERRLRTEGELVLREADVLPAASVADPRIEVEIEALPDEAGYRCKLRITQAGQVVDGADASTECRLCTDDELAKQVSDAVLRIAARIPADEPPEVAAPVPGPESTAPPRPPQWTVGKLGGAGIGLTAGGGLLTGLGLGLAIAPPLVRDSGGRSGSTVTLSGVAVAVVGGAALVSGIVMMLLDRKRSRGR